METYAKSEQTRFASGGTVQRGWQAVFDRYRLRYPDRAAMGRTIFSDLEVTMLSPDSAVAFGRWRLEREGNQPHGLFTLVLRKLPEGWRIIHDHTSVGETASH
jgi:ketosteroid isomerase-like protein